MGDIQQRLQTIFQTHRLVFWYDDNAELKEEFDNISIGGVEKLIIENNEFGIKQQVLSLAPKEKFLIYSPTNPPKDEDNWLLDLNIANYMFSADKTSLILQNLGLDVTFKEFIGKFDKFFNAPRRQESLKELLGDKESEETLALKMMAVGIGCDDNIASVMLRIFDNEKHFETLCKFGLDTLFFQAVKRKFSYEGDTLKDLIYKLLQNHFYFYIDKSKCMLNSDARLFVKSWMDSSRHKESFKKISKQVENELNVENIIAKADTPKLMSCDTYEKCDRAVISHLLTKLSDGNISSKEITKNIALREHTFWFGNYENIYRAILSAAKLFDFVKETSLKMNSFDEGIDEYSLHWYKADQYYREYSLASSRAEHLELLKSLSSKIEDLYLNGYLRELNDYWQSFADTYTTQTIPSQQQKFYNSIIEPHINKKQKVFVIISDALRYECGVALSSKIASMDKYRSTCKSMVSSLPSYTQLGMAALLPHKELAIRDKKDTVFVDGKSSSGMLNRDKILKSYEQRAYAIGHEEFLKFNRNDGREFVKNSSVIYIYHDEIDKMGEKNESKTFDAVESTFDTLIKIVTQISNFNGSTIYITSDHGFLYTNKATGESEFCSVQSDGAIKINRRFIIGEGLKKQTCVSKYDSKSLGIEGKNDFLIAKSINKIRVQGGGNRFVHGGASLQELVIPLISVKKARVTDVKEVSVEIIPLRNISTNSVNVSLYQSEKVDEKTQPIRLKIAFETLDGIVLSDEVKHTFDSTEEYDTNRESRFRLTLKQDISQYNNKTIKLVARKILDDSSESPIYKELEVKLALSFFNDFDDDF